MLIDMVKEKQIKERGRGSVEVTLLKHVQGDQKEKGDQLHKDKGRWRGN